MTDTTNKQAGFVSRNKIPLLILLILLVVIIFACCFFLSDSDKDSSNKKTENTTETIHDTTSEAVSGSSAASSESNANKDEKQSTTGAESNDTDSSDTASSNKPPKKTTNFEEIPEPTLNPNVADDEKVKDSDPEPLVELADYQKTFNSCMESGDYKGAKEALDSYFADTEFAIDGNNTFYNYVYYYEKQDMYLESIQYQLDYIEKEFGLDNVISTNDKYVYLLNTLKYVDYSDPRLEQLEASAKRWDEIQQLLEDEKYDTVIKKIQGYIKNGLKCGYAYRYIGQAYNKKPDYFAEAKAYYIYLLQIQDKEQKSSMERSFYLLFLDHINGLYNNDKITYEQRIFLDDEVTADLIP